MSPIHMVQVVLDELASEEWRAAQAQARKLEEELVKAFSEYLDRRYGAVPAGNPGAGGAGTPGSGSALSAVVEAFSKHLDPQYGAPPTGKPAADTGMPGNGFASRP
jgi:hypothetical protein